jgi:hypothetical protein
VICFAQARPDEVSKKNELFCFMKRLITQTRWVVVINLVIFAPGVFAQGALTPPGAPAAMFKTLQQVEPRTPISSLPFTISAPGSYYLTTNLAGTGGIAINASHVSIDLRGFTLDGTGSGANGFSIGTARTNIYIANGIIRNWGGDGIQGFSAAVHLRIENLHAAYNGGTGFDLGRFCEARNCSATRNGGGGFNANNGTLFFGCIASTNTGVGFAGSNGRQVIQQCISEGNTTDGFFGSTLLIKDCVATRNGRHGLAVSSSHVKDCMASDNGTNGISGGLGSFISDCLAERNGEDGIEVSGSCRVVNNHCFDNGRTVTGAGIQVTSTGNHIEGNRVVTNDRGIDVTAGQNLIIRNSAQFNGAFNYVIAAGNIVGPSVNAANIGTSSNPHSNYDF